MSPMWTRVQMSTLSTFRGCPSGANMTTTRLLSSEANDQLTVALINAASQGLRPHCSDAGSWLWLSEDPADRRLAAAMCSGCPVFEPCDEVGQHQHFGTWGGVDRTVRPGRPKKAAA